MDDHPSPVYHIRIQKMKQGNDVSFLAVSGI